MRVEHISWLSEEAREAEMLVRAEGATAKVFCHPCHLLEGDAIKEPLHAFGVQNLQIADSPEEKVENTSGLGHYIQGKLINSETQTVVAKGFTITIDDYMPGGIKAGDIVSFTCSRLDCW